MSIDTDGIEIHVDSIARPRAILQQHSLRPKAWALPTTAIWMKFGIKKPQHGMRIVAN